MLVITRGYIHTQDSGYRNSEFPIKNADFPSFFICLPEGNFLPWLLQNSMDPVATAGAPHARFHGGGFRLVMGIPIAGVFHGKIPI
jgi:hypothetical protein